MYHLLTHHTHLIFKASISPSPYSCVWKSWNDWLVRGRLIELNAICDRRRKDPSIRDHTSFFLPPTSSRYIWVALISRLQSRWRCTLSSSYNLNLLPCRYTILKHIYTLTIYICEDKMYKKMMIHDHLVLVGKVSSIIDDGTWCRSRCGR